MTINILTIPEKHNKTRAYKQSVPVTERRCCYYQIVLTDRIAFFHRCDEVLTNIVLYDKIVYDISDKGMGEI